MSVLIIKKNNPTIVNLNKQNFFIYNTIEKYLIKNNLQVNSVVKSKSKLNKSIYSKQEFRSLREEKKLQKEKMTLLPPLSDTIVCWGWKEGKKYTKLNTNLLILEHGYIFNRNKWISLGWNGLNGRADFLNQNVSEDRWKTIFEPHVKPWKKDGEYILLCGQVPGDAALNGLDLTKWYAEIAKKANEYYKIPVIWRPHPVAVRTNKNISVPGTFLDTNHDLKNTLKKAKLMITYNSNSSVIAAMEGVPSIVSDVGSMTYEISNHEIGPIDYPDRSEWGRKIAYAQWHISEIASGIALDHIFQNYFNTVNYH